MRDLPDQDHLHALATDLFRAAPDGLHFGISETGLPADDLHPIEHAAVSRARDTRRREFAAGRRAARQAMLDAGRPRLSVPMSDDRSPVWPRGLRGSISHVGPLAIATVTARTDISPGLDIEEDDPLDAHLIPEICHTDELFLALTDGRAARRGFSAKEAAYKAQYPLTHTIFGFDGLRLKAGGPATVQTVFTADMPPFAEGATLPVWQRCRGGLILSLCLAPDSRAQGDMARS